MDVFHGLPSLQILGLSRNNIGSLPLDILAKLSNLEKFYLRGNRLACLPRLPARLTFLALAPDSSDNEINSHRLSPCGG